MALQGIFQSERHWYHPQTGEHIVLPYRKTNHSHDVQQNPERYGLSPEEVPEPTKSDYDDATLWAAMQNGWVRLFVDRRQPDFNTNVEGVKWRDIRKTVDELVTGPLKGLKRLIVVQRTGPNDKQGNGYLLDEEQIEFFLRKGRPPRQAQVQHESVDPEIEEIRRRAGIVNEAGAGLNRVLHHIHEGTPFIMMSAERPGFTPRENRERNQELHHVLRQRGFGPIRTMGWWDDQKEQSFFAPIHQEGITGSGYVKRAAVMLAKKYDQDAVIVGDGSQVLLLSKEGDVWETFDATTIRPKDLSRLQGKTEIRNQKFGLIKKHDSRFEKGVGKKPIRTQKSA